MAEKTHIGAGGVIQGETFNWHAIRGIKGYGAAVSSRPCVLNKCYFPANALLEDPFDPEVCVIRVVHMCLILICLFDVSPGASPHADRVTRSISTLFTRGCDPLCTRADTHVMNGILHGT